MMKNKRWYVATLMFVLALAFRLYKIDAVSIWMDEDAQAERASGPLDFSMVERAATQHQPPIDYYLEGIGLQLFGFTEMGARVHAAILGALAAALFFLLLKKISLKPFPAICGTLAFIVHPWFIRYSQEGRPISCTVFFATLYLYILFSYLIRCNNLGEKRFKVVLKTLWYLIVLTLGTSLFLLSTGFQPVVFVVVSCIALIPFVFQKKYRSKIFCVYLTTALSFLTTLPILKMAISEGKNYIKEKSLFQMLDRFLENFNVIPLPSWEKMVELFVVPYEILFRIFLILIIPVVFVNRKKRAAVLAPIYVIIFIVIYPIVFDGLFNALISYKIRQRYLLSFAPVVLMTVPMALNSINECAHYLFREYWPKLAPILFAFLVFLFSSYLYQNICSPDIYSTVKVYRSNYKADWRSLYALFKDRSKNGDYAYMMNLTPIDKWNPGFHSQMFYYPKHKIRPVALRHINSLSGDFRRSRMLSNATNIYFVTQYGYEKVKPDFFKSMDNIEVHLFNKISVVRIKNRGNNQIHSDLIAALDLMRQGLKKAEDNYKVYETLMALYRIKRNPDKKNETLEELKRMDKRGKLKGIIKRYN